MVIDYVPEISVYIRNCMGVLVVYIDSGEINNEYCASLWMASGSNEDT